MRKLLAYVFLLLFSGVAYSADWELSYFGQQQTSGTFVSSPQAHCSSINGMIANQQSGKTYHSAKFEGYLDRNGNITTDMSKVAGARCSFQNPDYMSPWQASYRLINPLCENGAVRDYETGQCPSQCETGMNTTARGPDAGFGVGSSGQIYSLSRLESVCLDSCSYNRNALSADCFFVSGSKTTTFCNLYFTSTGDACSADDWTAPDTGDPLTLTDPSQCPEGTTLKDGGCASSEGEGENPGGENPGGENPGGENPGGGGENPGGGTNPGGGDGDGDGNGGTGGGPGDGEGLNGGCEGKSCEFIKENRYGDDVVPGYGETMSNIYKGIKASPIGQSVGNISFPTGGSCPTGSVNLLGTSIRFDAHCDIFDKVAPILKFVFLACWALLSVRIFLSA